MNPTLGIVQYQLSNVLRSRWLIGYGLFFLLVTDALLRFGDGGTSAVLSLINVVLLLVPLVSIVFGTMYVYDAREFTELLLAQPVRRRQLFAGLYLGLVLPLALSVVAGVAVPFAMHGATAAGGQGALMMLLATAVTLTAIFTALACVVALRWEDKVRGLGAAIAIWLALTILYDGSVLLLATMFAQYPIEQALLGGMLANPVDLARIALLLQFDISALMGYTGAAFRNVFGSAAGIALAVTALALWVAGPVALGARLFARKDF